MKVLLRKLQLQFDGPVQVGHTIDNFSGKGQPIRTVYFVYVQNFKPFVSEHGTEQNSLQRDNLQLLKTDVKEQIANWCRKQAEEEGGITEVEFEDGYEERDDKALRQLNEEL